jgi:hypothetical protein
LAAGFDDISNFASVVIPPTFQVAPQGPARTIDVGVNLSILIILSFGSPLLKKLFTFKMPGVYCY